MRVRSLELWRQPCRLRDQTCRRHAAGTGALLFLSLFLASCAAPETRAHRVVISVPEQRMALLEGGNPIATYPVSTSKFGLGDWPGSRGPRSANWKSRKKSAMVRRSALCSKIAGAPVNCSASMRPGAIRS